MPRVLKHPALKEPLVFPSGTSDMEMYAAFADKLFPKEELPPVPKEEAGFFGGIKEGITTLGDVPETLRYLVSPTAERRKAAAEAGESEYEFQRLKDIEGLGGLGQFVKEQAGSALGFIAAPAAAAFTAARVTPGPPIVKGAAATGTFLTSAGLQYLADTTSRQAQEQEIRAKKGEPVELPDATKILLTSAGQAGLDVAGFKLFKPLGQLIGLAGKETAKDVAKEVAEITTKEGVEAGAKRLIGKQSIAKGAAQGAAFEALQEVAQQTLERFGAGLDLASDEALAEYFESAVGGGLLGAPLGGGSAYVQNVRRGAYDKNYLQQVADSIQGKKVNLQGAWDDYSRQVAVDAPTFNLTDDQGNFLPYTPELLQRLGIDPEAKAINLGGKERVSIPMEEVLKADTGDQRVGKTLLQIFRNERLKLGEEIKRDAKVMDTDTLTKKVAEYETLTSGLKTYEAFFSPQKSINSPTNFVIRTSEKDAKKFEVFNPVTGQLAVDRQFTSEENARKYVDSKLQAEKTGKFKAPEVPAAPTPTPTPTPAPAAPTPEEVSAQQAQDIRDNLYKDLAARYPDNPEAVTQITQAAEDLEVTMSPTEALAQAETEYLGRAEAEAAPKGKVLDLTKKLEDKEDAELEAGILETEKQRGNAALTPEINTEIQEALDLAGQALTENSTIENRGLTFFPEDTTTAQEFVAGVNYVYEGLEKGTLPNAVDAIENLRRQANTLKQTFQKRIEDATEKPTLTVVPTPTVTPSVTTEPAPPTAPKRVRKKKAAAPHEKYVEQILELPDPTEDLSDFAEIAKSSKDTTIAKELFQLAQTYSQANIDSRNEALPPADRDAAVTQANNIYNQFQEIRENLTPKDAAQMNAAVEANGNAKEAGKVSKKVRKDICG